MYWIKEYLIYSQRHQWLFVTELKSLILDVSDEQQIQF